LGPKVALSQADYPNRPVKVVSPFAAGGITDAITRNYTKGLQDRLGQPFVLDHRPGASTNIAGAAVAAAPPDGYTLFISTLASHALNKWSYKNLPYDPDKLTTAGMMGVNAFYVVVRSDSPYNSVQDLVKAAKESPTGLSYGTHGEGGANHIITELFRIRAGIPNLLHIPYKGLESHRDLIAGRIDFMIDGSAITLVNSGRLKAIAVAYPQRWPTQPNVPTMAEAGYPDATIATFFGISAPPGTPNPILDKLNQALIEIGKDPEVEKRLMALNVLTMPATRQDTEIFVRQQSDKWRPVLKSLNIAFN
jgi:tripartite-type tricarboxylate transporter receptor subunit TctC